VHFFGLCFVRIASTFIRPETAWTSDRNIGALAEVEICELVPEYTMAAYIQIPSNVTSNSNPTVDVTAGDTERIVI